MKRKLSARQMQMIALGGTIGVGLFMGSTSTIKWTGPSVLIAYAIAGLFLYMIMRALGEMLYVDPDTGSFSKFATEYIHPLAGFLTAWSNIFQFVIVGMSEMIAIGGYFDYWWPHLPDWIPGLVAITFLCLANLISVKMFGELEFWFALIKVVTIILMIIIGLGLIIFGIGNHFHPIGISNMWTHGFFTGGFKGFIFALAIVLASYQGIELIGVTAGEAENPRETLVKAIRSTVFRILIFYIGAIFVILSIYPWNELDNVGSPFVETFAKIGITAAASIINFVVITAALSGSNSGIYSASRMSYTLANNGQLPKRFLKLNRHGVPFYSVIAISFGIFLGVVLNFVLPLFYKGASNIFIMVYSSSVLPGMIPWFVILISQIEFRKQHKDQMKDHPFKMPFSPYSNYITLFFLLLTLVFMFINPETRISIWVGVIFLVIMTLIYFLKFHGKVKTD
ncbi:D-alanine/D-serine/glycine permease [Secundilactobacillus paracollinoides]|uniref:D-alanine/D-serine/glycine permease n=1 Tax=Secundilactobacillus paracollinoides TaxID=240427 RepID=A0A1B2IXY8_9LACO|nr:amino acid permease [Secundilactobacillus paracollinoides]ANZ61011.1 D-alanine/D-serine/glycine permease [Secundilactobacillus paracollinoides]ANZ64626.1 D-alanine/D-serine/glycine permease [Secundilactobacillus paracollinoides]ANZ66868.1 D-alanine/D-serine/glycine permease [Secundilactobacillus paracollinoides]KRL79541.1 amino acid H(+) symporter [Secundilactobacillus paracollinoides DSM 15502 = JCM 11969]